jgi:choline dehydrogenase
MYDYIIIGAGSAGCVMANRLSANPQTRVCLIEAGPPDRSPLIHVPLGLALIARAKSLNWGYDTQPETALNGRRLYWPRGRVLGGSSSVNAMIYARGAPEDYAGWQAAAGDDWSWTRVQRLFTELEENGGISGPLHGSSGDLAVNNLRSPNPLSHDFVQAGVQTGFAANVDFNGAAQEGVGLYQVTQSNGQRFSAARAFLDPCRPRKNLTIMTGALVDKIVLEDRRAVGVCLIAQKGGPPLTMSLAQGGEVILSAGAVNSPQILLRTGIGPVKDLAALGISPIVDAPEVGRNLADHLDIGIMARTRGHLAIGVAPRLLPRAMVALREYILRRNGMLTSNVAEAGGFVKSAPDQPRPNLQLHFLPALLRDHGRKTALGYGITLHICDLLPKSRGHITLASPRAQDAPNICANYLSHDDDMATLLAGLKIGRLVLAAPALAQHISREIAPGGAVHNDTDLTAYIRAQAQTIYHPVGTCRMGRDGGAVVDGQGRVQGALGLRVVDASIMPNIIAGNTNAPTMMLAENIARIMLGQNRA